MSPTIRSVDGKPLLIGGLVAGADECCCGNPPPPGCFCPGNCSYNVSVVGPASVAVKSPNGSCPEFSFSSNTASAVQWLLDSVEYLPGWSVCDPPYVEPSLTGNASSSTEASVVSGAFLCHPDSPGDYIEVIVTSRVGPIGCKYDDVFGGAFDGVPVFVAFIDILAKRLSTGFARLLAGTTVSPPTFCQYNADRSCGPPAGTSMPPNGFLYFETPMDVVVERAHATANGAEYPFTEVIWSDTGGADPALIAFVEALADASSFTFRITSRPNCEPEIYCDCTAITEGLTISVLGAADFIWNQEEQYQTYTDLANFYSYSYSPQGPGNEARIVIEKWNLSITETYARWTIDIFCEAVPSGIPSPYRWYGSQLVECFEYDAGSVVNWTKKTYMGYFNCEADPCGTNGRSLGDLYPAGPWRDGELVSEVTPDTYGPCAPPLPYDFRVDNNAECP